MIVEDGAGNALTGSSLDMIVVDQNGNRWYLMDDVDGLILECADPHVWTGVSVHSISTHMIRVKQEQRSVRSNHPHRRAIIASG